jgi:hypothetical protein
MSYDTPGPNTMDQKSPQLDKGAPKAPPQGYIPWTEIETRFTYHAPKEGQPAKYTAIREQAKDLAQYVVDHTPESREQSLVLTAIEEAVMWANAAIARRSA